jgi:hypothetical protein
VRTGTTWALAELGQLARQPHLLRLREALADAGATSSN